MVGAPGNIFVFGQASTSRHSYHGLVFQVEAMSTLKSSEELGLFQHLPGIEGPPLVALINHRPG